MMHGPVNTRFASPTLRNVSVYCYVFPYVSSLFQPTHRACDYVRLLSDHRQQGSWQCGGVQVKGNDPWDFFPCPKYKPLCLLWADVQDMIWTEQVKCVNYTSSLHLITWKQLVASYTSCCNVWKLWNFLTGCSYFFAPFSHWTMLI